MRKRLSLGATRLCVVLMLLMTLGALWSTARAGTPRGDAPPTVAGPSTADAPPAAEAGRQDATSNPQLLIASLFILVLTGFVGFEVIGGVSPLLHTPLMALTNAISAISVVGALLIAGSDAYRGDLPSNLLGLAAVTAAMINVVGGFMITYRMLRLFKPKESRHS